MDTARKEFPRPADDGQPPSARQSSLRCPPRLARPLGWALTAVAYFLAYLWKARIFDDSGPGPALLTAGTVFIALTVIALGTRSRRPDLLVAGTLAFISPIVALVWF